MRSGRVVVVSLLTAEAAATAKGDWGFFYKRKGSFLYKISLCIITYVSPRDMIYCVDDNDTQLYIMIHNDSNVICDDILYRKEPVLV